MVELGVTVVPLGAVAFTVTVPEKPFRLVRVIFDWLEGFEIPDRVMEPGLPEMR